jgi:hypothetical protein
MKYKHPDHYLVDPETNIKVHIEAMDERTLRAFAHYIFAELILQRKRTEALKPLL